MVLYACASCLLGWSTMSQVARNALAARGCHPCISLILRLLIVAICACGAAAAWIVTDDLVTCLSFSFACAFISAILACDLLEHIIPTELVAVFAILSCIFRTSLEGIGGLIAVAIPVIFVSGCLLALNRVRTKREKDEVIGSGDVRMLVPLAIFSGCDGIMVGVFTASLTILAYATMKIITGKASFQTNIALAPGLVAWFFVGALIPLL